MASPKVKVREVPHHPGQHVAWCYEDGCEWLYVNVAKTDVQMQATWHRQKHRDAAKQETTGAEETTT